MAWQGFWILVSWGPGPDYLRRRVGGGQRGSGNANMRQCFPWEGGEGMGPMPLGYATDAVHIL